MRSKDAQKQLARTSLNIVEVEKIYTLGKLAVALNTEGHSIRVLNEMSVSDGGNCLLWLVILKSVLCSVGDTF